MPKKSPSSKEPLGVDVNPTDPDARSTEDEETKMDQVEMRQSAAPFCQRCGQRMRSVDTTPTHTLYKCPRCAERTAIKRPAKPPQEIPTPECPWCKIPCEVDNIGRVPGSGAIRFRCPNHVAPGGCTYFTDVPDLSDAGRPAGPVNLPGDRSDDDKTGIASRR